MGSQSPSGSISSAFLARLPGECSRRYCASFRMSAHGGLGEVFSSWVGMGQNQTVSASQIQNVLGSNQIEGLASKLGVNQSEASQFLADHLPKIVDKLTPTGQVEAGTDQQEGLMTHALISPAPEYAASFCRHTPHDPGPLSHDLIHRATPVGSQLRPRRTSSYPA